MTRKEISEKIKAEMVYKGIKYTQFKKLGLSDISIRQILTGGNYRIASLISVLRDIDMELYVKKMEDNFYKNTKRLNKIGCPEDLKKVIQDRMDEYDEDANGIGMDCDMNPDTIRRVMRTGGGTMVSIEKIFDYLDLEVVVE